MRPTHARLRSERERGIIDLFCTLFSPLHVPRGMSWLTDGRAPAGTVVERERSVRRIIYSKKVSGKIRHVAFNCADSIQRYQQNSWARGI